MEVQSVMCMIGGQGETSYAKNSGLQGAVMTKVKPILRDTVMDLYAKTRPRFLTIADFGCSSGPNALLPTSEIIDSINSICKSLGETPPQLQVYLNDLPWNDWNSLFKSIASFSGKNDKKEGDNSLPYFIAGQPGSFYKRLFPSQTLYFVHSSYSLQILSQVPTGIENNKGNVFIASTSPPNVFNAYLRQFHTDFTGFLSSRAEELVPGGRMVLTFLGRSSSDVSSLEVAQVWEWFAQSLRDLVSEGLVQEAKLDSFNWPGYYPSCEEVRTMVEEHKSLHLDLLKTIDVSWDPNNEKQDRESAYKSGVFMANFLRAVAESTIVSHFGEGIIDVVFHKYAVYVGEMLMKKKCKFYNIVMCMTKHG